MPITREQWTAALRSGDYEQTHFGLMAEVTPDHVGFCCLGVACMVAGKPEAELIDQNTSQFESVNMGRLYVELGLNTDLCDRLAVQNDKGVSFAKLADVIDALPFYRCDEEGASAFASEAQRLKEEEAFDLLG